MLNQGANINDKYCRVSLALGLYSDLSAVLAEVFLELLFDLDCTCPGGGAYNILGFLKSFELFFQCLKAVDLDGDRVSHFVLSP